MLESTPTGYNFSSMEWSFRGWIIIAVLSVCAPLAHAAEDCTDQGLEDLKGLKSAVWQFQAAEGEGSEAVKNAVEKLKNTVFSHCFDRAKASIKDIVWHYYVDLEKKTVKPERIINLNQVDFDFYSSHGYQSKAKSIQQKERKLYEIFSEVPPDFLTKPIDSGLQNNCSAVDLSGAMPPVRDQGQVGWCSLFANADLLSFELKEPVSASYLGMLLSPNGEGGAGGREILTINDNYGLCRESTLPSHFKMKDPIEALIRINHSSPDKASCRRPDVQAFFPKNSIESVMEVLKSKEFEPFLVDDPALGSEKRYPGTQDKKYSNTLVSRMALKACEKDRQNFRLNHFKIGTFSDSKLSSTLLRELDNVDRGLDHGKPVFLAYSYLMAAQKLPGAPHASVIVGRRFIDGKCQYLVRNSWGVSSCTKSVPQRDACQPPGHFWIDFETLEASIVDSYYIE